MKRIHPLVLLLSLSVLLKGTALYFAPEINPDGVRYIFAAKEWVTGGFRLGLTTLGELPFYPILLAAMQRLVGDWVLAGQLLSTFSLTVAVIPLYLLTRQTFGQPAALWAGLAFVVSPEVNDLSTQLVRDPLYLSLLLWSVLFAWRALSFGSTVAALGGFLLGFAALLLRAEAILFLFVFAATALVTGWREAGLSGLRRRAGPVVWSASIPVAIVFIFRGHVAEFFAGSHGIGYLARSLAEADLAGTYGQVYAALKEWESTLPNAHWGSDIAEIVRHNLPLIYLIGFLESFSSTMYPLFFVLASIGLVLPAIRKNGSSFLLVLVAVYAAAAYFSLLHRNFLSERYLLVPAALLLCWTGAGFAFVIEAVRKTSWRKFVPAVACACLALPLISTIRDWRMSSPVREAGRWLAGQNEFASSLIICNDDRIPFYAGRGRNEYGTAGGRDLDQLEQLALARDGDVLAVRVAARHRDAMLSPKHFEAVREFADDRNSILIFRKRR